jgi:hypothetical protein
MNRQTRLNSDILRDDAKVTKTASATLASYELQVEVDSTSGVIAIAMAPVAEMAGRIVTIHVTTYVSAITVTAADDTDFEAPALNGALDGAVLYSDGRRWWTLSAKT